MKINDKLVAGLIALENNLYIVFKGFHEIAVHDNSDFAYIRSLTVEPLKDPYDITGYGSLLYISERDDPKIHKFQLVQETTSTWSVEGSSMALSMTSQQNVLATCCEEGKRFIVEYSRFGDLVRRIDLANDVITPKHAICLSNGNVVVCHGEWGDKLRRVCLIDSNGDVIKSFGGSWGFAVGSLNEPIRLASYKGFIFIADSRNDNVQVLTEDLEIKRELVSDDLITMCVDTKSNALLIGNYDDPNSIITRYQLHDLHCHILCHSCSHFTRSSFNHLNFAQSFINNYTTDVHTVYGLGVPRAGPDLTCNEPSRAEPPESLPCRFFCMNFCTVDIMAPYQLFK